MIDIYFDPTATKVGVKLSGGADSAIIYYAVCDHYKDRPDVEIYTLTMDTELKWWYSHGANKIIEKVGEMTGKYPVKRIVYKNDKHRNLKTAEEYPKGISRLSLDAVREFNLDITYSGLTINPPVNKFKKFFEKNNHKFNLDLEKVFWNIDNKRDKDRDVVYQGGLKVIEGQMFDENKNFSDITVTAVRPFIQCDKRGVNELYHQYGVFEELYPLTYSCEEYPRKTVEDLVHCGHCFFCLERYYGFGRIV